MLNKTVLYKFMTTKQLSKCVDKIKTNLEKEQDFDKRLDDLEKLAVITKVLLRRCKNEVRVIDYTMTKLNELATLVK